MCGFMKVEEINCKYLIPDDIKIVIFLQLSYLPFLALLSLLFCHRLELIMAF